MFVEEHGGAGGDLDCEGEARGGEQAILYQGVPEEEELVKLDAVARVRLGCGEEEAEVWAERVRTRDRRGGLEVRLHLELAVMEERLVGPHPVQRVVDPRARPRGHMRREGVVVFLPQLAAFEKRFCCLNLGEEGWLEGRGDLPEGAQLGDFC